MNETLYETDILIIVYPSFKEVKSVIIIDPYDSKVEFYRADSIDEVKELLLKHLPWCSQGHPEMIELGNAYVVEWESLPKSKLVIGKPIDVYKVFSNVTES